MQQLNLITSSNKTIMYDQYCKMLIGHPYMLFRIISCFVEEAKHLSLDEIKKLIKGVRIGDKIVNPHFHLMDKEAFIKDEGLMCYDIYFYIDLPQPDQSAKESTLILKFKTILIQNIILSQEASLIAQE